MAWVSSLSDLSGSTPLPHEMKLDKNKKLNYHMQDILLSNAKPKSDIALYSKGYTGYPHIPTLPPHQAIITN
jgi:hypothetical protein